MTNRHLMWVLLGAILLTVASFALGQGGPPPDWQWCTAPSWYVRACEVPPPVVYTSRWNSAPEGSCSGGGCANHGWQCLGADGAWWQIMGQYGSKTYPRPDDSAGALVQKSWDDCYISHINPAGGYPCDTARAPGGTQHVNYVTWAQLPPGGYKDSQGTLHHCGLTPSPIATLPLPTLTPTVCVPKEVTRLVIVTATPVPKTATPITTKTKTATPCPSCSPTPTRSSGSARWTPTP